MSGRNLAMERLAISIFPSSSSAQAPEATAPKDEDTEDSTIIGEEQ